jgi:hypothetical protein
MRDTIQKIHKAKRDRVLAQVVECLLSKIKALSSNPSATKKNKKQQLSRHIYNVFWGLEYIDM